MESEGIFTYLTKLDNKIVLGLYQCPWSCLCVFRSLNEVSKALVLRFLYLNASLTEEEVLSWSEDSPKST